MHPESWRRRRRSYDWAAAPYAARLAGQLCRPMAERSKRQNCRFWAKTIFSICRHVSTTRAYYMFSLWLYLLATDVAKRSKRQNFANLLWQIEVTAITMANGSNYLIELIGYVTSPMAERSKNSQPITNDVISMSANQQQRILLMFTPT